MKKVFALCIGLLLFTACEQDTIVPEIEEINVDQTTLARKAAKVDVCHKGKIINVSANALPAHQGHGDAVDMDGDGYFDIENPCSEVDLDDSIPFDQSTLVDEDGDGFFTAENPFSDVDCDDTNAEVNPDSTEIIYNGIDDDCDPLTLDDDLDEDGYNNDVDCDDTNADYHEEIRRFQDNDGDGFGDKTTRLKSCVPDPNFVWVLNGNDCDDNNAEVNPGAEEACDDEIDNNCNGEINEDCGPTVTTVTSATGKVWMDRNLGATQVATSSTDADSYGDFYQWGRATTDFTTVTSYPYDWSSPQNNNLWQGVNGANNPCPDGFRIPTETEWNAERQSWSSNNAAGALASPLKLSMAGNRSNRNGSVRGVGSGGGYWSSTVSGPYSRYLYFYSDAADVSTYRRADGRSVRCLKD